MTDEMFARAVFKKAGRPKSVNPKQMISLRLPAEVVARWKATGPGWQTRMAERLAKAPLPRAPGGAGGAAVSSKTPLGARSATDTPRQGS
jgi:hypothetical protein